MEQRPDRFTAVLDANVLAARLKCNILLHLAEAGFFRPRWSSRIIDEMERAMTRGDTQPARIERLKAQLDLAFPEACVINWESYENAAELPDPDDRHVLAAAIKCDAAVIVTDNMKDFPAKALDRYAIEPVSADHFMADLIDLNQSEAANAINRMREGFRKPSYTSEMLFDRMTKVGLIESAAILRALNR